VFGASKKRAAKLMEEATQEAKRGLAMNTDEGRTLVYNTLISAIDSPDLEKFPDGIARLWMYLGDMYFQAGDADTALSAYADAVISHGGLGDPEIHLRLGKLSLDRDDEKQAADNLARALIMGGKTVFKDEDDKYFDFLMTKLEPPPEGWDAYQPNVE